MKKNTFDVFELSRQGAFEVGNKANENFFLSEEPIKVEKTKLVSSERQRRLNDYDFNLLREDAYKDVTDDLFKLEYKISKIEDEIKSLHAQIQAANDINDLNLVQELTLQLNLAQDDYVSLTAMYNDKSLSAKVSESISGILGDKFKIYGNLLQNKFNSVSNLLLSKLPASFSTIVKLRKSLNKLENINKSVDELMSMNIPYGENINKYEQLSKYIIKANEIQSELSKIVKK